MSYMKAHETQIKSDHLSIRQCWLLSLAEALQGLRLRSFLAPSALSFTLEMLGIEPGTFCLPGRGSTTQPLAPP